MQQRGELCEWFGMCYFYQVSKISGYDQEMLQSQTTTKGEIK